jgi:chaperone required for assembly of F1-ATPase
MNGTKRFYREVVAEAAPESGGYRILLDGKPVRTPAANALVLPTAGLADAIAAEWRAQEGTIRPDTMILTKLANTAIDQVRPNRASVIAQILAYANSDLLCYRAEAPESLAQRQIAEWNPLLDWAVTRWGANLVTGMGIVPVEQPPQALAALEGAIAHHDDFALAGLHAAATLLGSAVLALALSERHLDAGQAFAAALLDERHQAERWGEDAEASNQSHRKALELADIAKFFALLSD